MRKIVQFQPTSTYVYALTEDGILWRCTQKSIRQGEPQWTAIRGPGDNNPFRAAPTLEQQAQRMPRGFCGPAKGRDDET